MQKNGKTVAHYPKLKLKGGICHVCNELTKEHCQLCELPLCIRATANCFYTFHVKIAVDENQHFLYKNETLTLCRCKNCNERKARFHCTKCSNETSGKKAFFCCTSNKNCFEQFHSRMQWIDGFDVHVDNHRFTVMVVIINLETLISQIKNHHHN